MKRLLQIISLALLLALILPPASAGVVSATGLTVTTDNASDVEETTATLNGTLTDDGGKACRVRFQYGATTDNMTKTKWQGDKHTNDTFSDNITRLDKGTLYHFKAQAKKNWRRTG